MLPWVRLHALKDYLDMPLMAAAHDRVKVTFNLVPSLLDQLELYVQGGTDPHLELTRASQTRGRRKAAGFGLLQRRLLPCARLEVAVDQRHHVGMRAAVVEARQARRGAPQRPRGVVRQAHSLAIVARQLARRAVERAPDAEPSRLRRLPVHRFAGAVAGDTAIQIPITQRKPAIGMASFSPLGKTFSANMKRVSKAIQVRLMTPMANITAISAQQQPTQTSPCRTPIATAPALPSRQ